MSDLGWYGRTWYDRKQNEQLETLSSQLSSQRSEARRLKAQLSKIHGNMEQRLSRLTSAFDAFVELSDLREELRAFQPAVATRHRARRILSRLIATAGSPGQVVAPLATDPASEMLGYWLPSALAGLVATLQGDRAAADVELARARDDDATRTDLFLGLALVLTERAEPAAALLPTLLDLQVDRPVTRAQRELWLAAAEGRFGDQGRAVVADHLTALVAGLPDGTRAAQVAPWRGVVDGLGVDMPALPYLPKRVPPPPGLIAPIRAGRQLVALADWYRQAVTPPEAHEPRPASDDDPPDPLYTLLQELVDEGAPEEQPLLVRVAELRRVVEADGSQPSPAPPRWHAHLDKPLDLLMADVRSTTPGRRAIAVRAATPLLATVADDLAAVAAHPPPDRTEVELGRYTIGYSSTGVDDATVTAARSAALASPPPPGNRTTQIGWSLVVLSGLLVVIGVAAGLVALGVVLGGVVATIGGWLLVDAHQARKEALAATQRREADWSRLDRQITEVDAALRDLRTQAAEAADDATATRARLDELFATGVGSPT